jgi:uncharacterized protein YciI
VTEDEGRFYVSVSEYLVSAEGVLAHLAEHRAWSKDAYDRGILMFSGRQDPPVGGLLGFRAAGQADAEAFVASDPFVIAGVSRSTVYGCTPTHYPWRNTAFDAFMRGGLGTD